MDVFWSGKIEKKSKHLLVIINSYWSLLNHSLIIDIFQVIIDNCCFKYVQLNQ